MTGFVLEIRLLFAIKCLRLFALTVWSLEVQLSPQTVENAKSGLKLLLRGCLMHCPPSWSSCKKKEGENLIHGEQASSSKGRGNPRILNALHRGSDILANASRECLFCLTMYKTRADKFVHILVGRPVIALCNSHMPPPLCFQCLLNQTPFPYAKMNEFALISSLSRPEVSIASARATVIPSI